jgi:phenylpropionate dioxygenase-like ring-hydroxylating dioxygenase large terminal subunit
VVTREVSPTPAVEDAAGRSAPVSIPAYRYVSEDFAAREAHRLWPRVWQLACSLDHVANAGDYFEYANGPLSVLIVRGDDGELRAFQNVCRHRGSQLCEGSGSELEQIRCPFHRWTWDLRGQLREVPSRREFGVLNDDYPLFPVQVDTWGPLVFVNLDVDAEPLAEFLEVIPDECAWARLEEFHCNALVSIAAKCNWKTLIEGFSETYHVQGIHREMLPMCDDVNGPQQIWGRHGRLVQSYGLPSPRLRDRPDDQRVWEAFIEIMGTRVGNAEQRDAGPAPSVPAGSTLRHVLADMVRERGRAAGNDYASFSDAQVLDMQQYNLFPNITVLVFADMLTAVRARPGFSAEEAWMDVFNFERRPPTDTVLRTKPFDIELPPDGELPVGLVLNQDVGNFERTQRGLRQPGLTHLTVSPTEECRVVNLHRNLEHYLGIVPSELAGLHHAVSEAP